MSQPFPTTIGKYAQILFNVNDHQLLVTIPIFSKYVLKSVPFLIIFGKMC